MIQSLFHRNDEGFYEPRAEAHWVFEQVSSCFASLDSKIQLADIQVLDLHEMEVIDAFRILRDIMKWYPEETLYFIPASFDDDCIAVLKKEYFYYEKLEQAGE